MGYYNADHSIYAGTWEVIRLIMLGLLALIVVAFPVTTIDFIFYQNP
jgi:hypothetical protein